MDLQTLAAEVELLSAHYSTETAVNLGCRPPRHKRALDTTPTAADTESGHRHVSVPKLSPAVLAFLAERNEDVVALANKPVVTIPNVPDDLPLKRYFISSSHNTYLLSWQLFGRSSAAAYTHVLSASTPAKCVEIDVWWDARPGRGMPIVTHGWTLSGSVPFVDVCLAIREALDREEDGREWPVFVSLECHVPVARQDELVRIMVECWGERLVQGKQDVCSETVTPRQLRGRIVLMVEYYPEDVLGELDIDEIRDAVYQEPDDEEWVVVEKDDDAGKFNTFDAALAYPHIADSLARLGFYARSMKPPKLWWRQVFPSPPYPPNVALNVNEKLVPHLPYLFPDLLHHAAHYLRRVYPHGLRVTSSNLDPLVMWRGGAHMACLNWQTLDTAMRLNEAMFGGTSGWAVIPDLVAEGGRSGGDGRMRFVARVVGLSSLPRSEGDPLDFVGYCRAELLHRDGKRIWQSDLAGVNVQPTPAANDVVHLTWDQTFEWSFNADSLAFIQFKVVRRRRSVVRQDEDLAVFCARLDRLASGWCLVRLLDMQGKYTGATLLCEFTLAQDDRNTSLWSEGS